MMLGKSKVALLLLVQCYLIKVCNTCTTVAVNGQATVDGVAMTIHTTDCEVCDSRLALVPGKRHEKGARHEVYGIAATYPRQTSDRAAIYLPDKVPSEWHVKPLATIPEVEYTYGVWESSYTLMNEMGLTFGESSCSGKIAGPGIDMPDPNTGEKGKALLSIAALMQLGLERCATSVCAVETMGALAEKYGFYGESFTGGEALSIADTSGDAWIFHIVQTYTSNTSAVWAARRVPKGHIAVVANEFIIQEIPYGPHPDFKHSSNLRTEAVAAGFIAATELDKPFNFQAVYGSKSATGVNYYATVRQHWLYSRVAPSLNLEVKQSPAEIPFSVKVEIPLDVETLMDLFRDHYQGTDHDLTKGILAGPFGNPKRNEGGAGLAQVKGQFARGISITRTSHTHLGYAHPENAACFYSPDEPQSGVFAPFTAKALASASKSTIEESASLYSSYYQEMRRDQFSRESAWWAFDVVANWMNLNYVNMSVEEVTPAVHHWQEKMIQVYKAGDEAKIVEAQSALVQAWWDLFDRLIVRYNDGTLNYFAPGLEKGHERIGYPAEFLKDINFDASFWRSVSVQDQISKECKKENTIASTTSNIHQGCHLLIASIVLFLCGVGSGFLLSKMSRKNESSKEVATGDSRWQPLLLEKA